MDPHGHHLEDSRVKLQGLARFAADHGDQFDRVWAVLGAVMKILDLKIPAVRDAVLAAEPTPMELYQSKFAIEYHG